MTNTLFGKSIVPMDNPPKGDIESIKLGTPLEYYRIPITREMLHNGYVWIDKSGVIANFWRRLGILFRNENLYRRGQNKVYTGTITEVIRWY